MIWRLLLVSCLMAPFTLPTIVCGQDKSKETPSPNFDEHIKPLLRQHCLKCHGDDKQEADLNLQSYGSLLRGGGSGKVVEAGRSSQSVLYQAITNPDDDARMPPNSPPLSKTKIELIRKWIEGGLLESSKSKSMVKARDLTFNPGDGAEGKPQGPPAMPAGLPAVEKLELTRPFPVLAMDVSPWAPLLAVAGQDQIRFLHAETEQELGRLAFPEGEPHVIRFSRDGAVLMVAGGLPVESGRVVLFNVANGKRLAEVGDEIDAVLAADLSPNQRLVALGGAGRVVKVYSTIDGTLQYKLTKHTDWITAVAFSPDGKKLATADRAGGIHLWDANSGGILLNLAEHKAAVRALDWRGDSRILASAGEDGSVIWWDVIDGFPAINKPNAHPPARPAGTYGTIPNGVLAARFDAAGNLATSGRDSVVRVWNPDGSEHARFNLKTGIPVSNVMTNRGTTVVSGDSTGKILFWKTKNE
jgi:WD40 repeat protein